MQVQSLEKYFGLTLFKRTKKGADTAEGGVLFSYAKRIFSLSDEMVQSKLYICLFKPVFLFIGYDCPVKRD